MRMRCHGCGVEKDTDVRELATSTAAGLIEDVPLPPLYVVDCQSPSGAADARYRAALVCHGCMARLDLDMWTCAEHWAQIDPVVPYAQLPLLRTDERRDDPTAYAP